MLAPLVLLAVGSIVAGWALFPAGEHGRARLPEILQPVFRLGEGHAPHAGFVPVAATISAILGILVSWYLYLSMPDVRASLKRALSPLLRVFERKYFFDDVYDGFVERAVVGGSRSLLWQRFDAGLVDGIVNGTGRLVGSLGRSLRPVQTGFVRHYALLVLAGALAVVSYLLWS
jgi:NADH-quinone oxidoreductase subunit L